MPEDTIDTGDLVHHEPSGEDWTVAFVKGDRLAWCGWPEGTALLADCRLLRKASPSERDRLLAMMAANTKDSRGDYAREQLESAGKVIDLMEVLQQALGPTPPKHGRAE